jgi:hypothetical protein
MFCSVGVLLHPRSPLSCCPCQAPAKPLLVGVLDQMSRPVEVGHGVVHGDCEQLAELLSRLGIIVLRRV